MPYRIEFWVDGGCRRNGRSDAVAAACALRQHRYGRQTYWTRGLYNDTTNQRAEITAIIMALEQALEEIRTKVLYSRPVVKIHSDSKYAVNCITDWVYNWVSNGWVNSRGYEVANRDLIEQMSDLDDELRNEAKVRYIWVPREDNYWADKFCNDKMDEMESEQRDDYSSDDSSDYYY